MMDVLEAIKGLDGYAEALASLSALLGSKMFLEKSEEYEGLVSQIKEKQTDGRWIAREIMKEIHQVGTRADRSGDMTGISSAIQRFVAADGQASEVLKTTDAANAPNPVAEALRRFRIKAGLASE
jgi:hypothetical protein